MSETGGSVNGALGRLLLALRDLRDALERALREGLPGVKHLRLSVGTPLRVARQTSPVGVPDAADLGVMWMERRACVVRDPVVCGPVVVGDGVHRARVPSAPAGSQSFVVASPCG